MVGHNAVRTIRLGEGESTTARPRGAFGAHCFREADCRRFKRPAAALPGCGTRAVIDLVDAVSWEAVIEPKH